MTKPEDQTGSGSSGSGAGSAPSAPWERGTGSRAAGPAPTGNGATGGGSRGARAVDPGPATQAVPAPDGRGGRRSTAVVDAPTSQIRRDAVPTGMPDLSEARRSVPGPANRAEEPAPRAATPRAASTRGGGRGPRRAALQVKRIDPWSAFKLSLVLSIALFLVWMIAVGVLYLVLDGMGVWERINTTFSDFVTVSDPNNAGQLIGPTRVFGVAAVIGLVNVLLFTAIATVTAFVYNLSSDLAGGVEVTLTERD